MFKNRIRTAAIAGIAALDTGISGTVVATAQVNDGSNQTEVSAADRYDLDLARANDAVRDDIRAIQADPIYAQTVVNRHALIAGDFDQSEESLAARIGELRTEVQGLLEEAVDLGASDGHGWWYLPESHGTRWSPRARARRHRGRRW